MKIFHICSQKTWEKYQYNLGVHHCHPLPNNMFIMVSEMGDVIQRKFEAESDVIALPEVLDTQVIIGDKAAVHLAHLGITPQHTCFLVTKVIRKFNPFFSAASI